MSGTFPFEGNPAVRNYKNISDDNILL